ncbi:MAG: multi-sensor signal transduction histidine kinase, partial [Chloroflexi bacterium]|nr:multi-sensor signal transduction histidine kinase [Chloroflexota bacterium]
THGWVYETRYALQHDENGSVSGLIGVSTDVTELIRAGEERARLAAIVDSSEDAIISSTMEGIIQSWNAGATRLFGFTALEAIGQPITMLIPAELTDASMNLYTRLRQGEHLANLETVRMRKDGKAIEVSVSLSLIKDSAGKAIGVSGISRDISERKQAQRTVDQARRVAEELALLREVRGTETQALAEVGAMLSSTLEPGELYQRVLEQVSRIVPCDYADVELFEDGWVVSTASWGEPSHAPGSRLVPLLNEQGRWMPVIHGKLNYVPDLQDDLDWINVPPRDGDARVRSLIAVPLFADGETVGSFSIGSRTPYLYSEHHFQLATALGERVMQALRNARLFAAEQERARAAEELAHVQNDFVAATSHELRTPLTAILGFAQLMENHWPRLEEAQRVEGISRIIQAANRQLGLVEDLLLLTTLDNDTAESESQTIAIAPLVRQAAEVVRATYKEQEIAISGPPDLTVRADPSRFLHIVTNLIDNAAKYSSEGSPVRVVWGVEDGMAVLRVQDYGPGIPVESQQYLFRRFGRVPDSHMRAGHVGTGLGLYLGRQFAQSMSGTLDLDSTSAEGSTFRLALPSTGFASSPSSWP